MSDTPYQRITDAIISRLQAGVCPWRQPWGRGTDGELILPRNLQTRRAYRGINVWTLRSAGHESEYWLTYKQAQAMGGHVRRGARAMPAVFWKWLEQVTTDEQTGERRVRRIPMLRLFSVFNVEQTEGIPYPRTERAHVPTFQAIETAETLARGYKDGPAVVEGSGDAACYSPVLDRVSMPHRTRFESPRHFYGTLFHELGHSTGHASRLDRRFGPRFGDHAYSREELVAEMTAAYLLGVAGIDGADLLDNSAAYLDHWARRLAKPDAVRWVVIAAAQAEKAADWIRGERPAPSAEMQYRAA
jgi:antirestriction protein ArdC